MGWAHRGTNSKIDRIASLLYLESQEGKARPLNKCGLISFAFPRWSRQNSRKSRPSWCRVGHPTPRRRTARSCANYFVDPLAHWQHGRWPDDALNVRPRPISNWRHHTPSSSAPRPRPSGSARVVLQILLIIVWVAFGLWALHRVSVLRPASSYSQRRSSTIAAGWILYWNRRRLVRRRFRRLVVSTVCVPHRLLSRMLASRSARVRWTV